MKNKSKKLVSKVKKDLEVFLSSEEGKILEQSVIETAAVLGIMGAGVMLADAHNAPPATHYNYLHNQNNRGAHISNKYQPAHSHAAPPPPPPPPPEEPCMNHDSCICDPGPVTLPPTVCDDPVGHVNTCPIDCEECLGTHDNWMCDDGRERHTQSDCTQTPGHENNIGDLGQHDNWVCDENDQRVHNEYCLDSGHVNVGEGEACIPDGHTSGHGSCVSHDNCSCDFDSGPVTPPHASCAEPTYHTNTCPSDCVHVSIDPCIKENQNKGHVSAYVPQSDYDYWWNDLMEDCPG